MLSSHHSRACSCLPRRSPSYACLRAHASGTPSPQRSADRSTRCPRAAAPQRASSAPSCPRRALGCLASSGELGERPQHPPPRRATRAEGRRPRAPAQSVGRLRCGGAPFRHCAPAHPAPSPCSPPAQSVGHCAARGASAPVCPQGRPRKNPSPARRNGSLARWRAHAVQAKPCGWLEDSPALTAPTNALSFTPPPGRKNGLGGRRRGGQAKPPTSHEGGFEQGQAPRHAGVGGAPAGRDNLPPAHGADGAVLRGRSWLQPPLRVS